MFSSVFDAIFWIAVASCVLAQIAIVRSVLRMRGATADSAHGSSPSPAPSPVFRRTRPTIEIVWVVIPALALAVVLGITWRTMHPRTPAVGHVHSAAVHGAD